MGGINDNEQVRSNEIEIKKPHEGPTKNHIIIEGFGKGVAISHEGALTTRRMMEVSHFSSTW